MPAQDRLDKLLVERGLAPTRAKAQALILAGRVRSGDRRLDKPGTRVGTDLPLEVTPGQRWVSRGGFKLAGALDAFAVDPSGRDALDVGASTGGFTEVLLEAGARRVIALDVGRGQLDWGLRNDERVFPLEGLNARHLQASALPFLPNLAVVDVSFISLTLVLPPVVGCLVGAADVVALIKPQFEVGRGEVGRGGIVRRPELHRQVLERTVTFGKDHGFGVRQLAASPVTGAEGNREFFVHLAPGRPDADDTAIARSIEAALGAAEGPAE
jgi:23S rRNA (cytidine1920-2'-O)/16S rRNA (cytidine1409-2'-O)-methyltransferase